jgi:hypothetical protein
MSAADLSTDRPTRNPNPVPSAVLPGVHRAAGRAPVRVGS